MPLCRRIVDLLVYLCCIHGAIAARFARHLRATHGEPTGREKDSSPGYGWQSSERGSPEFTSECCARRVAATSRGSVSASLRQMIALENLGKKYNCAFMLYYKFYLIKMIIIRLWFSEPLAKDYGLVDCFLVGRTYTPGRMNKLGPPFLIVFHIIFYIYRYYTEYSTRNFKFNAIEFLLHEHDEVLANELSYYASSEQHSLRAAAQLETLDQQRGHTDLARLMAGGAQYFEQEQLNHAQTTPNPFKQNAAQQSLFFVKNSACSLSRHRRFCPANCDNKELERPQWEGPEQQDLNEDWILRPNRTSKSWSHLFNFSLVLAFVYIGYFLASLSYVPITSLASWFNHMGFEINYSVCARWLKSAQTKQLEELKAAHPNSSFELTDEGNVIISSSNGSSLAGAHTHTLGAGSRIVQPIKYSYIHMALNRTLACELAIDEVPIVVMFSDDSRIVRMSAYGIIRILLDALTTFIFFMDYTFCFVSHSYILFITSFDVIINSMGIERKLKRLNENLRSFRYSNKWASSSDSLNKEATSLVANSSSKQIKRRFAWNNLREREHDELTREAMSIQSIIVDHFALVRGYNHFTSYYLFILIMTLFLLFGFFAVMVLTLRSSSIELEFFVSTIAAILFVSYLLSGASVVNLFNTRLHNHISSAMALDETKSATKLRWVVIMKYYQPNLLFCFTLFNEIEISWLFCLKLFSWSMSAILVMASFLNMYRNT